MSDPIISDQTQSSVPPTFPEMTDIPTMPENINSTITPQVNNVSNNEQKTSEPTIVDIPPMITTSQPPKGRSGKMFATILGIFLLIGAIGAGVVLVGQKQLFQQKAGSCGSSGASCGDKGDPLCCSSEGLTCKNGTCTKPPSCGSSGASCGDKGDPLCCSSEGLTCKNGVCTKPPSCSEVSCTSSSCTTGSSYNQTTCWVAHYWCEDGVTGQGSCDTNSGILVHAGQSESYSKDCGVEQIDIYCPSCGNPHSPIIRGTDFISISHEVCTSPTTPPNSTPTPPSAACYAVKAYDTAWKPLTSSDLSKLSVGNKVRFTVSGSPPNKIDKARFAIGKKPQEEVNSVEEVVEVTDKKPGTDEFFFEYTIPAGSTSFTVTAKIHHLTLGWF